MVEPALALQSCAVLDAALSLLEAAPKAHQPWVVQLLEGRVEGRYGKPCVVPNGGVREVALGFGQLPGVGEAGDGIAGRVVLVVKLLQYPVQSGVVAGLQGGEERISALRGALPQQGRWGGVRPAPQQQDQSHTGCVA